MKLIDKDAVEAELKRRVEAIRMAFKEPGILSGVDRTYANAQYDAFKSLLTFLDTIEVKEVDLEKEVRKYVKDNGTSLEEPDEFLTTLMQLDDMVIFAKHFYELGLKSKEK